MPKLTGQTVEQAKGALRELGLSVALQERASTSAKVGTVLAQTPAAGRTVEPGAMVSLTIAGAPAPAPAPRATAPTPDAAPAATPAPVSNSRLASLKRETADSKQQYLQAEKAGQEAVVAFKLEGERLKALMNDRVTVPVADLLRRAANQATEIGRTLQGVEQASDAVEAKMKAALARWPTESAADAEAQAAQISSEAREAARTAQRLVDQLRSQLAILRRVNADLQAVTPQQLQTEVCQSLARNNRVVEGQMANYLRNCQLAQARAPACWRTAEARGLKGAARDSFMGECHRRPG
jgi:hypothetical protein